MDVREGWGGDDGGETVGVDRSGVSVGVGVRGGVGDWSNSRVSGDRGGVGDGRGDDSGVSEWSSGGWGVSKSNSGDSSLSTVVEGSQVSGASSDNFWGVMDRDWSSSWSYREGIAGDSVSQSVGDVVGLDDLTVWSYIAEGSDLVSMGILDGVVGLERFGVSVAGLTVSILGMVLGLDSGNDWGGSNNWGMGSNNWGVGSNNWARDDGAGMRN